jgi:hypothetical protein
MSQQADRPLSERVRRAGIALIAGAAIAAIAAPAAQAMAWKNLIVVPPKDLPQLVRQGGDAMLLHDTVDGRTLLYVERGEGGRLAIFDVSDPAKVKNAGLVQLQMPGAFGFVAPVGDEAELIRFRLGQASALLDLQHAQAPVLRTMPSPTRQGALSVLGSDGFIISTPVDSGAGAPRDYQVLDAANLQQLQPLSEVKQVRQQLDNAATGTTFPLTDEGLYLIRRPSAETAKQFRDQTYAN